MSTSTAPTPTISEPTVPTPSISLIKTREGAITKVTGNGLTGPNWVTWQVRMMSLLALCEVEPYVRGEIQQPNREARLGMRTGRKTITTLNISSLKILVMNPLSIFNTVLLPMSHGRT